MGLEDAARRSPSPQEEANSSFHPGISDIALTAEGLKAKTALLPLETPVLEYEQSEPETLDLAESNLNAQQRKDLRQIVDQVTEK